MMNLKKGKLYKSVFKTANGKEVLKDLLRLCKYHDPTYVAGDPHSTAYYEGMRRVALYILNMMKLKDVDSVEQLINGETNV